MYWHCDVDDATFFREFCPWKHVKVSLWMQAVGTCALPETSKSSFSNSMLKSLIKSFYLGSWSFFFFLPSHQIRAIFRLLLPYEQIKKIVNKKMLKSTALPDVRYSDVSHNLPCREMHDHINCICKGILLFSHRSFFSVLFRLSCINSIYYLI